MGIMVYSLFWLMQGLYHQPYVGCHILSELFPARFLSSSFDKTLNPKPSVSRSLLGTALSTRRDLSLFPFKAGLGFRVRV